MRIPFSILRDLIDRESTRPSKLNKENTIEHSNGDVLHVTRIIGIDENGQEFDSFEFEWEYKAGDC